MAEAEPLNEAQIAEYIDENLEYLFVTIGENTYSREDLWHCDNCDAPQTERRDLDDHLHCETCAHELWVEGYYD